MFNFKQYDLKKYNVTLVLAVIFLCCVSAYCVMKAGGPDDGPSYFKKQIMGLVMGLFIIAFVSLIDYHFICRFVILYYIGGVVLLVLTKFSPLRTDHGTGSDRWLRLPGIDLQPSELSKIILILVLAVFFVYMQERMDKVSTLIISAIIMAVPTALIMIQSDLSSSMVMMFIFAVSIFAAGLSYKIIVPILAVGLPVGGVLLWYVQQPYQRLLTDYQQNRILGFLNPRKFPDLAYQQNYSVQAIASGQVYGKLIMEDSGASRGYNYVAVKESDFIYSVIGEEFGFLGGCVIIGVLLFIIIKCVLIARKSRDRLGYLIAVGVSAMFMFQVFANIGVATQILPNTGLPLPFLSQGLTSLMSCMIAVGLVINIGLQKKNIRG